MLYHVPWAYPTVLTTDLPTTSPSVALIDLPNAKSTFGYAFI